MGKTPLVLPDTSAWIQHQLAPDPLLSALIDAGRVVGHPLVVGELWLGCGARPRALAEFVASLPTAQPIDPVAVRRLADGIGLVCSGIGWVDACLIASCALSAEAMRVYSKDRALISNARRLGLWVED